MKILIVDDDAMILHLLQLYVGEKMGNTAIGVRSGVEALSLIRRKHFDLAMIDLCLPDMMGFKILENIRLIKSSAELPVIVMTATEDLSWELKTFELGGNDFLKKPLNPDVVVARVRNLLGFRSALVRDIPKTMADPEVDLSEADLVLDTSASSAVRAPASSNDTAAFYGLATVGGPMVPCEMAVILEVEEQSYFCKTIKIGAGSIILLSFNELPRSRSYRVQLAPPNAETIVVEVMEKERRPVRENDMGTARIILDVLDGQDVYFEFCSQLSHAYRFHGMDGLRDVLAGGFSPGNSDKEHLEDIHRTIKITAGCRYRFVRPLGKGGFASVYLVQDLTLKRQVAMKVLSPRLAVDSDARAHFLGEAQIAGQFHHPHVVFVYEVGEYNRRELYENLDFPREVLDKYGNHFIYFTMHYIEGRSLADVLRKKESLSPERVTDVCLEVLDALSFSHQKGVIHRDIKPGNIMFDENGHVIVTDFGIASLDSADIDENGPLECTPRYASPEQLMGQPLDGRSDLYSLGVTMYHLLAGEPPFRDKNLKELVKKQLTSPPPSLTAKVPNLNPHFETFIAKCLAKKPNDRYRNAGEAAATLASLMKARDERPTGESTLKRLLEKVLLLEKEGDVVELLDKLVGFLHLHQSGDVETLNHLQESIAEPAVLDALLSRGLAEEHFDNLYRFFKALGSSRAVFTLLRWFEKELWPIMKAFLARLAVVSAATDLKPLADYCLELTDGNAVLVLRAFGEEGVLEGPQLLKSWSRHRGGQTRMELLRQIHSRKLEGEEVDEVLAFLEGRATQSQVRRLARKLRG